MKEAMFWKKEKNNKIKCNLCPRNCHILEGNFGFCGVRKNINGILYSLTYGKPVAINIDPIEKKPLYHFYPGSKIFSIGTFGCNLKCGFCQNYDISQIKEIKNFDEINEKIKEIKPDEIVRMCIENKMKFLAFTYNEPTIFYEYMFDIAKLCKKNKIKTVMVSNGQINEEPLKKLLPYTDAFNIDLKSFTQKFYSELCKGTIEDTKRTIEIISKSRKHIEVTLLLIKGHNDNKEDFKKMCKFLSDIDNNIVLHISRAFPYYKMNFEPTPVTLINEFRNIAKKYLKNVYTGNI